MSNIFFIGGVFYRDIESYVVKNSFGVVQNAADAFQKNLLLGMTQVYTGPVIILNFPFVGSYPKRFRYVWFKKFQYDELFSYRFLNLSGIKLFSRFLAVFKALKEHRVNGDDFVIVYSVHLPFLAAVTIYKIMFCRDLKVILIAPDLPEFMASDTNKFIACMKYIQSKMLKVCYRCVDGYVFLTKYMHEKLPINIHESIVVEGISTGILESDCDFNSSKQCNAKFKSVFYSGTLDERYGIKELVQAVELMPFDIELLICGDGNAKTFVLEAAERSHRIKYLGQLSRDEVLRIQRTVTLLVNPRTNVGEFTKYSFPSKIIEYMSSGRPVLMYKLDGIPEEYYDYCYTISSVGVDGLVRSLVDVLSNSEENLHAIGSRAKKFVLCEKSGVKQANKIIDLMKRL